MAEKRYLTPGEVASALGVHPSTLRRWAAAGLLHPIITPGGHARYAPADLRSAFKQRSE